MKTCIKFPITLISSIKKLARLARKQDRHKTFSEAQESIAKQLGFADWPHFYKTIENGSLVTAVGIVSPLSLTFQVDSSAFAKELNGLKAKECLNDGLANLMKSFDHPARKASHHPDIDIDVSVIPS